MSLYNIIKNWNKSTAGKIANAFVSPLGVTSHLAQSILGNDEESDIDKQIKSTEAINAKNEAFAREQFEYQKYLNRNQISIQASDASRAGINPIAMHSGSLSSGSFNLNQQTPDYSIGAKSSLAGTLIGSLAQVIATKMTNKTSFSNTESNNETAKDIADKNNASAERINKERLKTEEYIASLQHDDNVSNRVIQRELNQLKEKEINNIKDIQDANFVLQNIIAEMKDENEKKNLELKEKELQEAIRSNKKSEAIAIFREISNIVTSLWSSASHVISSFGSASILKGK